MRGSRGGGGQGIRTHPLKNHKNTEILSNTGPDPLNFSKFSKLPSQHSTLDHHRHPSETPFKWRFAGGPMMAHFFSDMWILSPLKKKKKRCQSCRVGPPLTKLSGSAHGSSSEAVVTRLIGVFRDSKKPSQNKRFVSNHHAVSLSLSLSLLLRPAIKVCEPARLKKLSTDIMSLQHATKTQTSLRKCAFTTHRDTHKV